MPYMFCCGTRIEYSVHRFNKKPKNFREFKAWVKKHRNVFASKTVYRYPTERRTRYISWIVHEISHSPSGKTESHWYWIAFPLFDVYITVISKKRLNVTELMDKLIKKGVI